MKKLEKGARKRCNEERKQNKTSKIVIFKFCLVQAISYSSSALCKGENKLIFLKNERQTSFKNAF